jgi:hypothetical protein
MTGPLTCVLCGQVQPEDALIPHYSRDYRGRQIVVLICRDARACIDRAASRHPPR